MYGDHSFISSRKEKKVIYINGRIKWILRHCSCSGFSAECVVVMVDEVMVSVVLDMVVVVMMVAVMMILV